MATEAIIELCRHDEALRLRQMRNARARTILFAVLAIANTSFAAGSIIMTGTSSTLPWALNVGFTVMGAGFAVMFWLDRKQWIALRAMSSPLRRRFRCVTRHPSSHLARSAALALRFTS